MGRIEIVTGDITKERTDAIVNAANSGLLGGGGVDGAIHEAAGPQLVEACHELRHTTLPDGLPPGDAIATRGFKLRAHWIIHTVGPNRHAGQSDPATLERCFRNSIGVARGIGLHSISFPAIGAGSFGWPMEEVAEIGMRVALADMRRRDPMDRIRFVLFTDAARDIFIEVADR